MSRLKITLHILALSSLSVNCLGQLYIQSDTIVDIDGNQYATIIIGNFEWMQENLRTTRFNNGDSIPHVVDASNWMQQQPAYCWTDNDSTIDVPYGKLYNWYVVDDSRNVCPVDWRVPDFPEWTDLLLTLDPTAYIHGFNNVSFIAGEMMRSQDWNGSNESGFNAYGAGYRNDNGNFDEFNRYARWWSRSAQPGDLWNNPISRYLRPVNWSSLHRSTLGERWGVSIRCVREARITSIFDDVSEHFGLQIRSDTRTLQVKTNLSSSIRYYLCDILGRQVRKGDTKQSEWTIDIQSLPAGVYVFRVDSESRSASVKFSK